MEKRNGQTNKNLDFGRAKALKGIDSRASPQLISSLARGTLIKGIGCTCKHFFGS